MTPCFKGAILFGGLSGVYKKKKKKKNMLLGTKGSLGFLEGGFLGLSSGKEPAIGPLGLPEVSREGLGIQIQRFPELLIWIGDQLGGS